MSDVTSSMVDLVDMSCFDSFRVWGYPGSKCVVLRVLVAGTSSRVVVVVVVALCGARGRLVKSKDRANIDLTNCEHYCLSC